MDSCGSIGASVDPSRGVGNGHLICSCDGLIIPCEADGPSYEAVKDSIRWIVDFKSKHERMANNHKLTGTDVPPCRVKVLGTMQSNFTKRDRSDGLRYVIAQYCFWMRKIDSIMAANLRMLQEAGLAFTNEEYEAAGVHLGVLCISRTRNWNSINGYIDKHGLPVAFLKPRDLKDKSNKKKLSGWERDNKAEIISECAEILRNARARVMKLLGGPAAAASPDGPPEMEEPLRDHRFDKSVV